MFNVKITSEVTTVSQIYRVGRKSTATVRLDGPFHRNSAQLGHDKCRKDDSSSNARDRTRNESDP